MSLIEKQQDKILHNKYENHKETLDKKFNTLEVINKTYANSTEYDLNDVLLYLGKVIAQTKTKNRNLVKYNFSKFVSCRLVLEEILDNMKSKNLHKSSTDVFDNITTIKSIYKPISITDDVKRERKIMILHKYKTLFDVKKLLLENKNNCERFVEIYVEAKNQYEEVKNSKVIQKIWESIKQIKIDFLENLFTKLNSACKNYDEILYYFDLYFQVDDKRSDRKIMNTLVVNYKKICLDIEYIDKDLHISEILFFYNQTLYLVNKELQKELTKHLFDNIKKIFKNVTIMFVKVWISRLKDKVPRQIDFEVANEYKNNLQLLKKQVIEDFLDDKDVFNSFLKLEQILEESDTNMLRSRLIYILDLKSQALDFDSADEVTKYFDIFSKFENHLQNKKEFLFELKKTVVSRELKKYIQKLSVLLNTTDSKHKKMMEIIRVIDRVPNFHKIILTGILPALENDTVVLYYLAHILGTEIPEVDEDQQQSVDSLKPQFGYILGF